MRIFLLVMILMVALTFPVWSQESQPEPAKDEQTQTAPAAENNGEPGETDESASTIDVEASAWTSDVNEDSSKAEEYGEVPEGFLINHLNANLNMKGDRFLEVRAKNVRLNNAQYAFDYGVTGKYDLYVDYTKIPHLFSKSGETIWSESGPGVWTLADSVQGAIQNLNPFPVSSSDPSYLAGLEAQRVFLRNLLTESGPTELGLQRNRGAVGFNSSPNLNWNYSLEYFRENRDGFRPYGTTLGFSWLQELPEHINYNTDRVRTGIEYVNKGRSFTAAYEFSGFNNDVQSMTWDNPLRLTDRAEQTAGDGTSRGRVQLAPNNHSNMISLSGSTQAGRGKITGAFAYSSWKSTVDLLPYTINSALPQVALPASGFDGELRNITADVRYYSPVGSKGTFTASYRLNDQKNNSDDLLFTAFAPVDAGVTMSDEENPHFAFSTNAFDLNFQWALTDSLRWNAGYVFNRWDREERETTQTDTNTFKTGLDATASDRITLHARYQYDQRRSDEFDLGFPVYDTIPLRRFDVANLNRNQFRVTADFSLGEASTLGVVAGVQNNDYADSLYGLLEAKYYTVGADFSYAFANQATFNAWYEHSQNTRDQQGRQSGSTPSTSTTFDWTAALEDTFDTFGIGYVANFKKGKCIWDTNFVYATANGLEDLTGGSAIRPTGAVDLNNVDDTDHYTAKTAFTFHAFAHAKFTIGYWYDRYTIDDFSEDAIQTDLITVVVPGPTGPTVSNPGVILLNARQPDYEYNTGWIGLIYSW